MPDEVLCSDALRTRKTFSGIAACAARNAGLDPKPSLHHAGPDVMMAVLKHGKGECVMMIGHNPGIAVRAPAGVEDADQPGVPQIPDRGDAGADFGIEDWADVGFGQGVTVDFVVPREIAA